MADTRSAVSTSKSWLERLWASLAERGRRRASGDAESPLDRAKTLAEALLSERGEASGAALARALVERWQALSEGDRAAFHRFIAEGFAPDPERLRAAARAYLDSPTNEAATRLADAADPVRQELLRRMNMAPGGTAALVAMRKDVLDRLAREPHLKPLDADLLHLFASWFNRGFLELKRIDWQSPAALLQKLVEYEAVHEIQGWDDLRRRVAPDRRMFGFFHPALPGEPLIFVEVALVRGLAPAVQPLLAKDGEETAAAVDRARAADTAIFYSISNCQSGLRGVSFGNFLIKQVVEELKAELPQLARFATLSPLPGFRRWVEKRLETQGAEDFRIAPAERDALARAVPGSSASADPAVLLRALLAEDRWWEDSGKSAAAEAPLTRLAALYLTSSGAKGPLDPVARFHLGNGARLERINWLGNRAPRGLRESWGLMVNYLYDPSTIEANHEAFARDGTIVRSPDVDALLLAENGPIPRRARRPRA